MAPPKLKAVHASKVDPLFSRLKLTKCDIPDGPKPVAWAIAAAMAPTEHNNAGRKLDFDNTQSPVVKRFEQLSDLLSDDAEPLAIETSAQLITDWNNNNPFNQFQLFLDDGLSWRQSPRLSGSPRPIFVSLVDGVWKAYVSVSLVPDSTGEPDKHPGQQRSHVDIVLPADNVSDTEDPTTDMSKEERSIRDENGLPHSESLPACFDPSNPEFNMEKTHFWLSVGPYLSRPEENIDESADNTTDTNDLTGLTEVPPGIIFLKQPDKEGQLPRVSYKGFWSNYAIDPTKFGSTNTSNNKN